MRTLKTTAVLAAAAAVLTVTACSGSDAATDAASASAVTLQNCGRTITMKAPAAAAVTVNQGATESALAIGAAGQLIGTAYLDDQIAPQWADAYAKIPVLAPKYPSREAVLAKHPDLVAASYSSAFDDKALGSEQSLEELGIASYVSPFGCADKAQRPKPSWDAVAGETSDYGTLFGRTADADRVNQAMRATLADLKDKAAGRDKTIMWWDAQTTAPSVGGRDGGPQLVMDAVGATNAFADLSGNWADTSWEAVLKANPDVIVLIDADWDPAAAKRKYIESDPALKDLKAVKAGSFIVIPFSESTPGARMIDGAVRLSDALSK